MSQPVRLSVAISAIVRLDAARALWASLPPVYRQCAVIYTDYWQAYETALRSQTSEKP
ncbi:hypothetical protein QUB25_30080 [Microcoleus sp. B3-D7]